MAHDADFLARRALTDFQKRAVNRKMCGVLFDGEPCTAIGVPWPVQAEGQQIGQVTSGIWSPRLERNIGVSMIDSPYWQVGQQVEVVGSDGTIRPGEISKLPFA